MDPSKYNVVYVDRRILEDKTIRRGDTVPLAVRPTTASSRPSGHSSSTETDDVSDLQENLRALFTVFSSVSICSSGPSCVSILSEIAKRNPNPTLLLLDIPWQADPDEELQNGVEGRHDSGYADLLYGTSLLRYITLEMERNRIPKTVVPVAVISDYPKDGSKTPASDQEMTWTIEHEESARLVRCVDLGAVDVLTSPFSKERTKILAMHCYKAEKQSASRGWSWVGGEETPPTTPGTTDFIYLREKMQVPLSNPSGNILEHCHIDWLLRVSELMHDIIKPRKAISNAVSQLRIAPGRMDVVRRAVGKWHFSAHEFTNDELLQCAVVILEHALKMPEVEQYRIPTDRLVDFLVASRAAYNEAIPYHNFRHVVDVLQACFAILLEMGALPPYPWNGRPYPERRSVLATLIRPVDALTLLISAVGHDAGHPGVNNAFLVNLKAPLAQLYNDKSVLESFHCAAFSQVIRKYWPTVQTSEFRKTMIDIILATDMGLHFDYMQHLDALKKRVQDETAGVGSWDEKTQAKHRILLLSLIIKCADISNVARGHECAAQWAIILIDEFSRQASMENQLGIPSALAVAPKPGSMLALARSQCGFMRLFAIPLFESLAEIVPELQISVESLQANIEKWVYKVKDCEQEGDQPTNLKTFRSGTLPASNPFLRSVDTDGEARISPSSLTNSRRSSGRWTDDSEARTREETPRSSTGSPLPVTLPVTRSNDQLDRLSVRSSSVRPTARRQITEPVIVVEDTNPNTSTTRNDNVSRMSKTLSSLGSRSSNWGLSSKSQLPTLATLDRPLTNGNTSDSKQPHTYNATPSDDLSPPDHTANGLHLNRPKSSPAQGMEADEKREERMRRKPSRFFKVKIWSRLLGKEES